MVWLKSCPRCRGDLFLDNDSCGWHLVCLQCGHRKYLKQQRDYRAIVRALCATSPSIGRHAELINEGSRESNKEKQTQLAQVK